MRLQDFDGRIPVTKDEPFSEIHSTVVHVSEARCPLLKDDVESSQFTVLACSSYRLSRRSAMGVLRDFQQQVPGLSV